MEKIEKTLQACDRVVNGIEDETLSTTSALLQCSKIVRLLNDEEAMIWLQYEYGGYPRNDEGKVPKDAWNHIKADVVTWMREKDIFLLNWLQN